MEDPAPNRTEMPDRDGPTPAQWLTTGFLAGLVALLSFQFLAGGPAQAEMTIKNGTFSAMTTQSTTDEELLYVIDDRAEQLLVYGTQNVVGAGLELLDRQSLPQLFAAARAQNFGGN